MREHFGVYIVRWIFSLTLTGYRPLEIGRVRAIYNNTTGCYHSVYGNSLCESVDSKRERERERGTENPLRFRVPKPQQTWFRESRRGVYESLPELSRIQPHRLLHLRKGAKIMMGRRRERASGSLIALPLYASLLYSSPSAASPDSTASMPYLLNNMKTKPVHRTGVISYTQETEYNSHKASQDLFSNLLYWSSYISDPRPIAF